MSIDFLIMPLLSLAVGLASVFIDSTNPNRKLVKGILIIALSLACVFAIYTNVEDYKKTEQEKQEKLDEIAWNRDHIRKLTSIITKFRTETINQFSYIKDKLKSFGWTKKRLETSNSMFRSIAADRERGFLSSVSSSDSRRDITIQYFPKNVDKNIVENSLEELGFRLISGPAKVKNIPTNSLWFGANVKLEDIKLVAYTLMRAGVEIKVIRPFRNPKGRRSNLIQVGADAVFENARPLSITEIKEAKEFKREG